VNSNRRSAGWAIALATVTILATTGTVYAATGSDQPGPDQPGPDRPGSDQPGPASAGAQVLVPLDEQLPASTAQGPMTLADGVDAGAFSLPAGIAIEPASCLDYLTEVLGPLAALDGWLQQGVRANEGAFVQAVIQLPDRDNQELIAAIRDAAAGCVSGTVTIDNPVTGEVGTGLVSYRERPTELPATAATYGATWDATVSAHRRITQIAYVASGETLLYVLEEGQSGYADELATAMYERLQTGG
jgi:hypothetical protein